MLVVPQCNILEVQTACVCVCVFRAKYQMYDTLQMLADSVIRLSYINSKYFWVEVL